MSQSNAIAGFLIAAFLIFITARGRLPDYASVFVGAGGSNATPSGTSEPEKEASLSPMDILVGGPNAAGLFVREKLGF